jgi:peptidoglycan/LPS O-acetylase OafA/YrhL
LLIFPTIIVPLVLIGLAGLLVDSHRRSWHAAQSDESLNERDRRFARSQYRRRMQASSLIGVIGATLGCYPLVPRQPLPLTIYLAAVVVACGCILLLALLDVWATRQNLRRIESEQLAAQVKLAMELRAARTSSESKR